MNLSVSLVPGGHGAIVISGFSSTTDVTRTVRSLEASPAPALSLVVINILFLIIPFLSLPTAGALSATPSKAANLLVMTYS